MEHLLTKHPMGWIRDYPDFRDYTIDHPAVRTMTDSIGLTRTARSGIPPSADLRPFCPPVENQLDLGSCTANAGIGLLEYYERKSFGRHLDASRLFVYKTTRNLMHVTGDTGATLRSTMAALALFGVPPEEFWPYRTAEFDREPPSFCYSFAANYQCLRYLRLDTPGITGETLLSRIRSCCAAGIPSMFGFTVYSSIRMASAGGKIPFPAMGERILGGHAVDAVGYDNAVSIQNDAPGSVPTTGAILIRNSWGPEWGVGGYGWLPYEFILKGLAVDWWVVLKSEWIDTGVFKL
jgi:C1A family cysteine protease